MQILRRDNLRPSTLVVDRHNRATGARLKIHVGQVVEAAIAACGVDMQGRG